MEHAYKSHTIVITTWASLDRNGYMPEVRISKKAPIAFQTLKLITHSQPKKKLKTSLWKPPKSGLTTRIQNNRKRRPTARLMQNQKRLSAKEWVHCNFTRSNISTGSAGND